MIKNKVIKSWVRFHNLLIFLYMFLIHPKKLDQEEYRKELVCNIILIFSIVLSIILTILSLLNYILTKDTYLGVNPFLMLLITIIIAFLLYISRINFTPYISHEIISLLLIGGFYGQFTWGADLPSVILIWSFVITTSSILISTTYSFYLSVLIGLCTIILQILSSKGILLPTDDWKTYDFKIDDAIEYSVVFMLIAGVSWLSNREIYKSLRDSRAAREELKKERDLLDIKVQERTEQLHKAQLEKINNMYRLVEFGRISSGLFHDLMSPLNTLGLSIHQINRNSLSYKEMCGSQQLIDLNSLQHEVDQCIRQSKRLIDYIDIARRQISNTNDEKLFDINAEIKNTISILNSSAKRNNINILFLGKKSAYTFGSPTLFSHIITNLISNAIDSYKDRSSADTFNQKLETNLNRKIIIYCVKKNRIIKIKIQDFGVGIPIEVRPRIFETFFTTKQSHGCGIGLSATKHTVEKYFHGAISFTSEVGQGTIFTIKIPATNSTKAVVGVY